MAKESAMNNRMHTRLTIEFLDVSSMNNRAETFITVENVDDVRDVLLGFIFVYYLFACLLDLLFVVYWIDLDFLDFLCRGK